jgi:hypothetical protein
MIEVIQALNNVRVCRFLHDFDCCLTMITTTWDILDEAFEILVLIGMDEIVL